MRTTRALVATDPRRFGKAAVWQTEVVRDRRWTFSDDMQLFAATFAAGFVFVSILIG